jgi:hypothetical protein
MIVFSAFNAWRVDRWRHVRRIQGVGNEGELKEGKKRIKGGREELVTRTSGGRICSSPDGGIQASRPRATHARDPTRAYITRIASMRK